jgi:hypothetical protein
MSKLSIKILPESGRISPVITEKQVVLPAPFGPSKPTASPVLIVRSTPFNTVRL